MQGRALVGVLFLLSLAIIFIGMALTVLPMVMGEVPENSEATPYRDSIYTVGPPLGLLLLVFILGVWIPAPFLGLLRDAAQLLEVRP